MTFEGIAYCFDEILAIAVYGIICDLVINVMSIVIACLLIGELEWA